MERVHILYSGRVQGVGFRFTAERIAIKLGLGGWVRNLPDSRVELIAEGHHEQLKKFISEIDGYFATYIRDAAVDWLEATGEFRDFGIRF